MDIWDVLESSLSARFHTQERCRNIILAVKQKYLRKLKQRRRRCEQERQKSNKFRLAKQQLFTCITLFCTFLCRHCTTTTWKCVISRFVEDVNTRQQLYFSFPALWYSFLQFNSRENCQHLIKIERGGESAIKFEGARMHFSSDVFVAVAVVVAQARL